MVFEECLLTDAIGEAAALLAEVSHLDLLTDQIGTAEGIVMVASVDISREKEVEALLSKYGAI